MQCLIMDIVMICISASSSVSLSNISGNRYNLKLKYLTIYKSQKETARVNDIFTYRLRDRQ